MSQPSQAALRRVLPLSVAVLLGLATLGCQGDAASSPPTEVASSQPTAEATREAVASRSEAAPSLAPDLSGSFSVGDHSLYIECYGTTGPVMLFDSGSGGASVIWKRNPAFLLSVDNGYRRCVYDRANAGLSGRDSDPRTAATSAAELHTLLAAAELPGPYVVVGRSFGGYVSRLFAAAYPEDVRALILVETLTPEFHQRMETLLTPEQWAAELDGVQGAERPLDVVASSVLVADAALPDVPLLVIAGTKWHSSNEPWPAGWPAAQLDALWDEAQVNLAASVPRGKLVVFEGGDHSLQISQPERLANEINDFVAGL